MIFSHRRDSAPREHFCLFLVKMWLILCAGLSAGGWLLSIGAWLNKTGYCVLFAIIALVMAWAAQSRVEWGLQSGRLARRLKKAPAFLIFLTAIFALAGGLAHPPMHVDAFAYRLPRMMHWLGEQRWHWIHTADIRLNIVAMATEWVMAPLFLFTRTLRLLFLYNAISYFFLPGLLFSVLTRLGVRGRTAWWWMWIIPSGYCYAMQAGGLSTDLLPTVFALCAIDFAMRARRSGRISDIGYSMLGMALATGAKQTNAPLILLWMVALAPSWRLLLRGWKPLLVVSIVAALASFLPITFFNVKETGHWKGFAPGRDFTPENSINGIAGNTFAITAQNLLPPLFPWADRWNAAMQRFLQTPLGSHFQTYESFGYLGRAPTELNGGIGLGVCGLMGISILSLIMHRQRWLRSGAGGTRQWAMDATAWFLLLLFMAKVGVFQNARYLAPYYPFLFPLFLAGSGFYRLTRARWWRALAVIAIASTALLVFASRQRPLFPAKTIVEYLEKSRPGMRGLSALKNAYTFSDEVNKNGLRLIGMIPESERVVGYAARYGDKEPALWKPYGARKVERVALGDSGALLRSKGIQYVFVDHTALRAGMNRIVVEAPGAHDMSIEEWLGLYNAELVGKEPVRTAPDDPPQFCYLAKLKS